MNMHGPFGRVWPISGSRLRQSTGEGLSTLSVAHDSSAVNPIATAHARSLKLDRDDDPDVGLEVGLSRYQFELKHILYRTLLSVFGDGAQSCVTRRTEFYSAI